MFQKFRIRRKYVLLRIKVLEKRNERLYQEIENTKNKNLSYKFENEKLNKIKSKQTKNIITKRFTSNHKEMFSNWMHKSYLKTRINTNNIKIIQMKKYKSLMYYLFGFIITTSV